MSRSSVELLEQSAAQWFLLSTCGAGSEGKHAAAWGLDGTCHPILCYQGTSVPLLYHIGTGVPVILFTLTTILLQQVS